MSICCTLQDSSVGAKPGQLTSYCSVAEVRWIDFLIAGSAGTTLPTSGRRQRNRDGRAITESQQEPIQVIQHDYQQPAGWLLNLRSIIPSREQRQDFKAQSGWKSGIGDVFAAALADRSKRGLPHGHCQPQRARRRTWQTFASPASSFSVASLLFMDKRSGNTRQLREALLRSFH